MISMSRKEQTAALKWCQHRSPIGYLVFYMNGKWGTAHDNDHNIIINFLSCWKSAKGALLIQGRKPLENISISVPSPQQEYLVRREFITLLMSMAPRLVRSEYFEELDAFSRDMRDLFVWDKHMEDTWTGYGIVAADGMGRYDERDRRFEGHEESEEAASMYAGCLLQECDVEKAEAVLSPFADSEDPEIVRQIELLRRLQAVKKPTA